MHWRRLIDISSTGFSHHARQIASLRKWHKCSLRTYHHQRHDLDDRRHYQEEPTLPSSSPLSSPSLVRPELEALRAQLKQCASNANARASSSLVQQYWHCLDESMLMHHARALARSGNTSECLSLAPHLGHFTDRAIAAALHKAAERRDVPTASSALAVAASLCLNQVESTLVPEIKLAGRTSAVRSLSGRFVPLVRASSFPSAAVELAWSLRNPIASGVHAHCTRVLAHSGSPNCSNGSSDPDHAILSMRAFAASCWREGPSWRSSEPASIALASCITCLASSFSPKQARSVWDFAVDQCGLSTDGPCWSALARAEAADHGSDSTIEAIFTKTKRLHPNDTTSACKVLNALLVRKARDSNLEGLTDVAQRMFNEEPSLSPTRVINSQLSALADEGDINSVERLVHHAADRDFADGGTFAHAFKCIAVAAQHARDISGISDFDYLQQKHFKFERMLRTDRAMNHVPHSLSTCARADAALGLPGRAVRRGVSAAMLCSEGTFAPRDAETTIAGTMDSLVRNNEPGQALKLWHLRKQWHSDRLQSIAVSGRALHALTLIGREKQRANLSLKLVTEAIEQYGAFLDAGCANALLNTAILAHDEHWSDAAAHKMPTKMRRAVTKLMARCSVKPDRLLIDTMQRTARLEEDISAALSAGCTRADAHRERL